MIPTPANAAPTRFVLLGASNARLGLTRVLNYARLLSGGPVELMAAVGLGRSYGIETSVMGRRLEGVRHCGLFAAARARPPAPTYALVTDIGNDLLYGQTVAQTLAWVDACVQELRGLDARVTVTGLPVRNLPALGRLRYVFFRSVFFPDLNMPLQVVSERARALDEKISQNFCGRDVTCVALQPQWYGVDPIHFRTTRAASAWRVLMQHAVGHSAGVDAPRGFTSRISVALARPEKYSVFRRAVVSRQPCRQWRDGSSLWLY